MDIIKQLTGEVTIKESNQVVATLQEDVTANLNQGRNGIVITDIFGKSFEIFTAQIVNHQLLPAVAIKFNPRTTENLWNVLFDLSAAPFFTEFHISTALTGSSNFLGFFADEGVGFPAGPFPPGKTYHNTTINEQMYFDDFRSRFLSIAETTLNCGRGGVTSSGAFLSQPGGVRFLLNSRGWFAPNGGVLVGMSGTRTDADSVQIELMNGAVIAAELDFLLLPTASATFNVDVTGGNVLTVRVKPGSNAVTGCSIILIFKAKSP